MKVWVCYEREWIMNCDYQKFVKIVDNEEVAKEWVEENSIDHTYEECEVSSK